MTGTIRKPYEIVWFEPAAGLVLLGLALYMNHTATWPWMWVIDIVACSGAALSYRKPLIGAILTGLSLAAWLPFETNLVSASGLSFFVNIFAASRLSLSWRVPLTLGLGGLAYLTLVRKAVEDPKDQMTTAIILFMVLVITYGGGLAFRRALQRVQREKETGHERLQNLQVSLARELHDSVAQTLSSAAMRANIIMGDPSLSPLALDQLERIADECRASAHDLRQLLSSLREDPGPALSAGPLAGVDTLVQSVEAQAERLRSEGFTVDVDVQLTKLSAARCQTLGAIAVEATNNMVKHAKPNSRCSISMVADDDDVLAEFTNKAQHTKRGPEGLGLTGIQERLTLLNGTRAVTLRDGQWILKVRLPLGTERSKKPASPTEPDPLFAGEATSETS